MNKMVCEMMRSMGGKEPDEVPLGWYSAGQITKMTGRCISGVLKRLSRCDIERKRFRVVLDGRLCSVPHYNFGAFTGSVKKRIPLKRPQ
jgi:hypothetical protein